jgi:lipopolysaccharide transport system ATP-binding protein
MFSESLMAVEVQSMSKDYTLEDPSDRWWKPAKRVVFPALKEVSFSIPPGQVVGVIGRNGAGKSTLLKILTRITSPTRGAADLYGRVGSLLEVGTGFHPELTGRENIFLNGAILGMRRAEIRSEFDAIVAFAGVERFLETPVKRYSSGMYVRLAFAVAAHLRSEILLIDEVLAVGDVAFQKKCLGKMRDVARSGRTVLFVSHHLQSVAALCTRALLLESGRLVYDGGVHGGIERYIAGLYDQPQDALMKANRPGSGEFRVIKASPERPCYECSQQKRILFELEQRKPFEGTFFISIHLVDAVGTIVAQCDSRLCGQWFDSAAALNFEFTIRNPWLKPGSYRFDIYVCAAGFIDMCEHACLMEVLPILPYSGAVGDEATSSGVVFADFKIEQRSYGIGNPEAAGDFKEKQIEPASVFDPVDKRTEVNACTAQ